MTLLQNRPAVKLPPMPREPMIVVTGVYCRRGEYHEISPAVNLWAGDTLSFTDDKHGHSFSFKLVKNDG